MRLIITILSFLFTQSLLATDYFVNQTTGTLNSIAEVNALQGQLQAGDNVYFQRGQSFTGVLTPTKSGVTYGAYGETGADPSINGWATPAGWVQTGTNIWTSQPISGAPYNLRVVVMNNVMRAKGKSPNVGYYPATYTATSATSASFFGHNYTGGELVTRRYHYMINVNNIGSQSGSTVNIVSDQDGDAIKSNGKEGFGAFIQNHVDCLDLPGEWAWNKTTKQLSIYSTTNPGNTVVVGVKSSILVMGAVSGVTFTNITFEGANTTGISLGASTSNTTFTNCTIRYMRSGVQASKSGNGTVFNNCKFLYTLNTAVANQNATGSLINNCLIDWSGWLPGMGDSGDGAYFAVRIGADIATGNPMSNGAVIQNSIVRNCGYVGIAIGGNGTIVQNNYIHDFCFVKDDGGGIYSYNIQNLVHTGRIIRNNIIINALGAPEGTNGDYRDAYCWYADGGTDHIEVYGNTFGFASYSAVFLNSANYINFHDNTVYGNKGSGIRYQNYGGNWTIHHNTVASNIFVGAKDKGQSGISFNSTPQASWGTADFNHYASDNNKVVSISGTGSLTLSQWRAVRGWDMGASYKAVTTDILFINNPTGTAKTINFNNKTYTDIFNIPYLNGYFTLPAFTSRVLFNTPNVSVDPNAPSPPNPPEDPELPPQPPVTPPTNNVHKQKTKFIIIAAP